jgi:hypothetical protein
MRLASLPSPLSSSGAGRLTPAALASTTAVAVVTSPFTVLVGACVLAGALPFALPFAGCVPTAGADVGAGFWYFRMIRSRSANTLRSCSLAKLS